MHLHSSMQLMKSNQMAVWCVVALASIIEQHGVPDRLLAKGFTNMFNSLARSILSQQLAVKAASVIQGRFMALCQVRPAVFEEDAVLELLSRWPSLQTEWCARTV